MRKDNNFIKQIEFANKHFLFKDCKYYPCHKISSEQEELNCLFCFCPFYPCKKLGNGKWIIKNGKKIYDCSDCNFIHKNNVVSKTIELIYEGKTLRKIQKILRKEFLKDEKER